MPPLRLDTRPVRVAQFQQHAHRLTSRPPKRAREDRCCRRYRSSGVEPTPEELLSRTPYLIADGGEARERFDRVAAKALAAQARAVAAADSIAVQARAMLGPCRGRHRSDLVAESSRLEGIQEDTARDSGLCASPHELLHSEVHNFVAHVQDDPRLFEAWASIEPTASPTSGPAASTDPASSRWGSSWHLHGR